MSPPHAATFLRSYEHGNAFSAPLESANAPQNARRWLSPALVRLWKEAGRINDQLRRRGGPECFPMQLRSPGRAGAGHLPCQASIPTHPPYPTSIISSFSSGLDSPSCPHRQNLGSAQAGQRPPRHRRRRRHQRRRPHHPLPPLPRLLLRPQPPLSPQDLPRSRVQSHHNLHYHQRWQAPVMHHRMVSTQPTIASGRRIRRMA